MIPFILVLKHHKYSFPAVHQHLRSTGVTFFKRCFSHLDSKLPKLMQLFGLIVMNVLMLVNNMRRRLPVRPAGFLICISISSSVICVSTRPPLLSIYPPPPPPPPPPPHLPSFVCWWGGSSFDIREDSRPLASADGGDMREVEVDGRGRR